MKKPFKTYNGGKAGNGTYQQIINQIPKCDIYIEAMVGNGGVLHNLQLPAHIVINDIDRSVFEKYFPNKLDVGAIDRLNVDYSEIIRIYDQQHYRDKGHKAFFYFDPPYLFETRISQKPLYKHEWTEADHIDFLTLAINIKSSCMISSYPCELYDTMLAGWRTHDFESMTRKGLRTERIYMNYPVPEILQDYRYTGTDYRERQRIKRKVTRHIKKLEALPNDERNAILSAVMAKYGATAASLSPGTTAKKGDEILMHRNDYVGINH